MTILKMNYTNKRLGHYVPSNYKPLTLNKMYDKISNKAIFIVFGFLVIVTITNILADLIVK